MMQGALVGNTDTPPAKLEYYLTQALKAHVCVLNTGHIGYSIEQYDQTLRALGDRFGPDFVVVSVSENDIGDLKDPAHWSEAAYWTGRIGELCNERGWHFLFVPVADLAAIYGPKSIHRFQAQFSTIFKFGAKHYVELSESLIDTLLRMQNEADRQGTPAGNPLFNLHLMGDHHFSPLGADLWARVVARRMLLVWDNKALAGFKCPEPVLRHAKNARAWLPSEEPAG